MTVVVGLLTVLAVAVVVLTRLRLGQGGAGRVDVGRRLLDLHTVVGTAAIVLWTTFLLAPGDSALGGAGVGILALACFWVLSVLGLMILARWLPSRGRHARPEATDGWARGPWLSVLAHVGTVLGVLVLTYAYLTQAV